MLYALTRAFYIEVLQHLVLKVRPGALQTLSEASTSLSWAEVVHRPSKDISRRGGARVSIEGSCVDVV
ncbi:hypothetical protein PC118_g14456 [Phytophthora cactorum]|uniref:Uncharacterized protein n=1 Tax=Phytophthora cactorum TaxID=29920 RepID=A0A8T1FK37_9STRA|nr:hypothetical protein PC118_g14456 [Phytophthora cactorum]KAG3000210.1 hypothetical protein PC120_g20772 [Phytophthora cactorum]